MCVHQHRFISSQTLRDFESSAQHLQENGESTGDVTQLFLSYGATEGLLKYRRLPSEG